VGLKCRDFKHVRANTSSRKTRDQEYAILLTRNGSSEAPWRVTSFRDGEPIGHREYDKLEGGSPIQNAFQEFAGTDFVQRPRPRRRAPSPAPLAAS
jgi:hypothetical protein